VAAWPNLCVHSEDIRAFARRDWTRASRAKLEHWQDQYRAHGPAPSIRAAEALRAQILSFARPALDADRRLDLENHVRLKRRIDAARFRLTS
jgi:hypothetical protein